MTHDNEEEDFLKQLQNKVLRLKNKRNDVVNVKNQD